jgi:murein DD-endopeptidase MepM/ murein hydrolase activator NlpD
MIAVLAFGYVRSERLAASEHEAALHAEAANADLQDELARLRDRLGSESQTLNNVQGQLSALADEATARQQQLAVTEQMASSKGDRITQLSRALEQAQRDLHLADAQRATLTARVSKAETDLAEEHTRQAQASANLDQSQKKLQQLSADRDRAISERDHLKARVTELEHKLAAAQVPGATKSVAEAAPAPASVAPAPTQSVAVLPPAPITTAPTAAPVVAAAPAMAAAPAIAAPAPVAASPAPAVVAAAVAVPQPQAVPAAPQRTVVIARGGHSGLTALEHVLGSAGVDVAHLFSQYGLRSGEGGPFVPVGRGPTPDPNALSAEKLAALRNLVKSLPISAPLESYEIGSGFGVRGDPINGHAAYHTGLDFRAPYMSPIYATAPGVVTYSGYRDDYGKVVEIDHGNGLTTRYAHMHRQTVSVGQRVAAHTQIGFLGSSGRATGPHVHYEVLVNGEPVDPEKFLSLARVIPAVAQQ